MPPKRKLSPLKEIEAGQICDYLIDDNKIFKKNCQDLFHSFQEKDSYKCLKSIGLEQISSALEWKGTPVEDVQNKARMHYEKIREITSVLEDDFEELIEEKLNGAFRTTIKAEILKFIQGRNSINGEAITENILSGTNKFPFIKEEIITTDDEDRISQNSKSSEASEKSKSSEASEKSKSSEVSEKSKSSEASEKSKSNMIEECRSNEVSEKSKLNKTEESKSNGASEQSKSIEASEKSKSIEASEKSKSNVTPEKNKLSKELEENKLNRTLEKNESTEVPEKSKSSVTPEKNKLSKALEENKSNKALEKNESSVVPEKNKSREATEKNKSHETPEKNKPSETPEINKPRETPEKKSKETREKNHSNGSLHSDSFLEELSLSSVHTSDLSSFDDEISISSEEGNEKRRVSLKFAADEIERVRQVKAVENQRKRKKTMNGNNRVPSSDSGSSTETSSARRVRKPNSKYFSKDVLSPFDFAEFGTGTNIKKEIDNAAPRKRGRPRKHLSD